MSDIEKIYELREIKKRIEGTINTSLDFNKIMDCGTFKVVIQQLNGWRDFLVD